MNAEEEAYEAQLEAIEYELAQGLVDGVVIRGRLWESDTYDTTVIDWLPMDECEHVDTICGGCVTSWSADWELELADY